MRRIKQSVKQSPKVLKIDLTIGAPKRIRIAVCSLKGYRPRPLDDGGTLQSIAEETEEWQAIFNHRTAVERVIGRMKTHRRLNNITVRHRRKVTVHSLVPVIVTQAVALAFPDSPRNCVC